MLCELQAPVLASPDRPPPLHTCQSKPCEPLTLLFRLRPWRRYEGVRVLPVEHAKARTSGCEESPSVRLQRQLARGEAAQVVRGPASALRLFLAGLSGGLFVRAVCLSAAAACACRACGRRTCRRACSVT